jgi:hypothetical protein
VGLGAAQRPRLHGARHHAPVDEPVAPEAEQPGVAPGVERRTRIDWTAGLYYFDQNVTTHGVTEYGSEASYWLLPATNSPDSLLDGYKVFNDSSDRHHQLRRPSAS